MNSNNYNNKFSLISESVSMGDENNNNNNNGGININSSTLVVKRMVDEVESTLVEIKSINRRGFVNRFDLINSKQYPRLSKVLKELKTLDKVP
jgi:hypothetical protein